MTEAEWEDVTVDVAEASEGQDRATGYFPGDAGALPLDTRRVLVQLLTGPFIDGRRHRRVWPVLLRDEAIIRSRLAELFLELVIDPDQEVAFTRQLELDEQDVPRLLRRVRLTFIESVLLLYLRQELLQATGSGERAVISTADIEEHLLAYERVSNLDRANFQRRSQRAIDKMTEHNLLQKIGGSDERYEISPTLKLLFTAEDVQRLTQLYEAMAAGRDVRAGSHGEVAAADYDALDKDGPGDDVSGGADAYPGEENERW